MSYVCPSLDNACDDGLSCQNPCDHRPDFQIPNGTFMLGDCLDRMREIPDGSVDMIVTSPPYDDLRSYNDGEAWSWDTFVSVADEIVRVLKPGGAIVWNVGDATIKGSETGTSFRQALHFKDVCGLNLHDTMIWNKGGFSAVGALATRYAPVFEYMFVLTKGKIGTFNPIKDRPNIHGGKKITGTVRQKDGTSRAMSSVGKVMNQYGQRFNVWDMAPVKSNREADHPAPFPVSLAQDHIVSWSNPGDIVLDPFGGSGTTAIAAERSNRRWICIERDPEYFAKAVERVRNEVSSKGLFA